MYAKSEHPPAEFTLILIDSGSYISAVGTKWPQSWNVFKLPTVQSRSNEFHFGDGPAYKSPGECATKLAIPMLFANRQILYVKIARMGAMEAVVRILISQTAMSRMDGLVDFGSFQLEIPS